MIYIAYAREHRHLGECPNPFPRTSISCSRAKTSRLTGTTGITLGNNRTLSTPWGARQYADSLVHTVLNAAPGAASVRLAGANGQTLTVNGPLELGSATLIINDTPNVTRFMYPQDGYGNFTRQPGGSLLNGTVVLEQQHGDGERDSLGLREGRHAAAGQHGRAGHGPLAMTVGASTANATTATLDLNGNNLAVSSLNGGSLGVVTNSSTRRPPC